MNHRGTDKAVLKRMVGFMILEYVLIIAGVIGVAGIFSGTSSDSSTFYESIKGAAIILGVICLIASGRVGIYVRKLAKEDREHQKTTSFPADSSGAQNTFV